MKDDLLDLLSDYHVPAKKSLGQHFLVDENAFERIIETADINSGETILEIGPGTGFLTERLMEKAKHVIAVELDRDMVRILRGRFGQDDRLTIIQGDALQARPEIMGFADFGFKIAANIPYYITSPLIKHFLQSAVRPSMMVLLTQKEVAEKVCGITGKSFITIETQVFAKPEIIGMVPAGSFFPPPKVDSAILKLTVYEKPLVPEEKLGDFFRLVKFAFAGKRKKIHNSLSAGLHLESAEMSELLKKAGIDPNERPEQLSIEAWIQLTNVIQSSDKKR